MLIKGVEAQILYTERLVRALGDACRLERTKQFAVRAVRLPESADPERINASYDNGVLTVKARGLPAGLPGRRCGG